MHTRTMSRRNRAAVAAGLLAATTAVVLGQQALASAPPDTAPAGSEASSGSAAAAPSGSEATQATLDIGSVPADFSIVYVPGLTGNPFYNTVACGAQARADELGIDFTYQGAPEFDVAKQSAIVSALVGQKPNAIMISVTDPDAMIPPLQEAKDAGIEVIGIDGDLSDTSIMGTNIQSDNLVGGALAAHSLVEAVGEDVGGDVLGLSNTAGSPIGEQREQGFTDELAKYPAFHYLGTQYTNNQQADAATIVSTTAQSNDNLVGVYTMNTNNTEGAVTGLREADMTVDDVKIVGYDTSEPILQALEDGQITGLVVQYPYGAGRLGVDSAVALANGQEVPRNQATQFVFATPDNVDTPEVQQFVYKLDCN
jgi:ribose transport system substrate-binding protein